ncbi:succinate dehydrogenase cytochrome b subunit [Porphyromonas crevioricanis]|uniref:Succinate dehydrogenase n=2 Tax=Porphyromonas crevioricanis TaxID=393921 RepID=A0AB34PFJ8_9PORP|nr:succinate dehydrogenase cytochrome b subunit [Porphyromonas crevioricanis]KGN94999.1 succinate dehydrogenase [Porphyromonas crevioricanis]SJZ52685.1 succinate dehydrogenase / fumarate reductase cytochrome b subunit [Porphyromonas crevioricanis]
MWLLKSSIGRKLVMSISGLFLITFLTLHGAINFVSVFSEEAYNAACDFMGTNPAVQVMVPVLALGFVIHIIYACVLTLQNRRARGNDRYGTSSKTPVPWNAKNMFVLGVIILGVLVFHLTHFWQHMQLQEWRGMHSARGYELVKETFSNPWIVACYLIWFAAVWYHLTHGFWSAFQTIGWNNRIWYKRLKTIGIIIATLIMLTYFVTAIYFLILNCCAGGSCAF